MESVEPESSSSSISAAQSQDVLDDVSISELRRRQRLEIENLTLAAQPLKTLKLFALAILQYLKLSMLYILTRRGWFMFLCMLVVGAFVLVLTAVDGTCEKYFQEFLHYFRFILWWVVLGVASSFGLGSGLHTFMLYLGPHIALFTRKAMQCGRVDLKTSPYDTIQLKRVPSWLEKDCAEYGPPLFPSLPDSLVRIPLRSILPQVQLEALLWGFGTALGELPPYFISRAACLSSSKLDAVKELDASSKADGVFPVFLKCIKCWLLQHLNLFTILVFASVPNPLFDLAGIMCGQFGIPFWKFFIATFIGKTIIKAHVQTIFVISICNNQVLEWLQNELSLVFGFIPGLRSFLPNLVAKVVKMKEKYSAAQVPSPSNAKTKPWDLSVSSIWNTIVWLVLVNYIAKMVTSVAQSHLRKQQEAELAALTKQLVETRHSNGGTDQLSE